MAYYANDGTTTAASSVSSVSLQKEAAEIEAQRVYLEQLAVKRQELKALLEDVQSDTSLRANNESGCWVASTNGSFFLFEKEEAVTLLGPQLEGIETELKNVCVQLQKATENR